MRLFDKVLCKFILVGIVNTLIGLAAMFALYNFAGIGYWFSSAAAYCFGIIFSFFLNKYFTFGIRHWSLFMIITYIITIIFSYFVAYTISKQLINLLLKNYPLNIRENIALFTGMCLFTGFNYLGQRLVVFKNANKEKHEQPN